MRTPESEAIGKRAWEQINYMCAQEGISLNAESENIGVNRQNLYKYRAGCAPSAQVLAGMVEAGYDVIYILTGRRSK